jgi:phosphoribosylformimino-5-aminoimidazole carboxamide ribonucleotide (ProFAR) isomerase
MNQMAAMTEEGDVRVKWNPDNPHDVEDAREQFERLKQKGLVGYKLDREGKKSEIIHDFDPTARMIVMAPAPKVISGG